MDLPMIDGLLYDDHSDYTINIIPHDDIDINYVPINNIITTHTYLIKQLITFVNNNLYHDEAQLTNIQYYRILAFLNEFI